MESKTASKPQKKARAAREHMKELETLQEKVGDFLFMFK